MLKNFTFTKNPLLIVIILLPVLVAVGIAAVFVYKQPNPSDLTASIAPGELNQTEPSDVPGPEADSQPLVENLEQEQVDLQPSAQPQIQEEPKAVSKPKVPKPAPVKESTPSVQSGINIIVSPSPVTAGGSATVTVSASNLDLSSIWLIDVYLESPTGLSTARGSIVNIDGEGRRFGSIAIPQDAELGTWKIKTVQMFDNTGAITSHHYGTDIFTTFSVATSQ